MMLQSALKLFLATVTSLVLMLENGLYTQLVKLHIFKGFQRSLN